MKQSEHVVLRARYSVLRLKKNKSLISGLLFEGAEKFQVTIYNNSLNSNHIHLLLKARLEKNSALGTGFLKFATVHLSKSAGRLSLLKAKS